MLSVCISAHGQDSTEATNQTESKIRFPVWYNPSDATDIYGVSLGLFVHKDKKQTINGVNLTLTGNEYFRKDNFNDVNGINFSVWHTGISNLNGISISINTDIIETNGIQIGLFNSNRPQMRQGEPEIIPIYGKVTSFKLGKSKLNGIQIGFTNQIFNLKGIQVGASNFSDNGKGVQIALINFGIDFYGTQMSILNIARDRFHGCQFGVYNSGRTKMNGLQFGLFNYSAKLNGVQIGLINWTDENWMPIINWNFE